MATRHNFIFIFQNPIWLDFLSVSDELKNLHRINLKSHYHNVMAKWNFSTFITVYKSSGLSLFMLNFLQS
jgi:hypothetical protein